MRVLAAAAVGAASLGALGACSTGGGSTGSLGAGTQPVNNRALCGLVLQLPDSASLLQHVDVRDPATFTKVLDQAVTKYVGMLDEIAPRADEKLKSTVSDVRRLVLAHKFSDATDARVPLDTWTADHC